MKATDALNHLAEICSMTGTCIGCPLYDKKVEGCILREYPPYMYPATGNFKDMKLLEAVTEESREEKACCGNCEDRDSCELEDIKAGMDFRPEQLPCRNYKPETKK